MLTSAPGGATGKWWLGVAGWKPLILFAALLSAWLPGARSLAAQQPDDPIIDPPAGEIGSRFQIVGQFGWQPGETVTLLLAFTTSADPIGYPGPFPYQQEVTVLRDGTWSFPIVVREDVLGFPIGPDPGYIIVRAEGIGPGGSGQRKTNYFVVTVGGQRQGEQVPVAGFGVGAPRPTVLVTLGLFALGLGGLLLVSGVGRRTAP